MFLLTWLTDNVLCVLHRLLKEPLDVFVDRDSLYKKRRSTVSLICNSLQDRWSYGLVSVNGIIKVHRGTRKFWL